MRLFACTVLIRNSCEPQGCDIAGDSTLVQLTESAAALGPQAITAAISFLAWDLLEDEEKLCRLSAVAIFILAVQHKAIDHKAIDSAASTCLISVIRSDQQEVDEWDRWSIDPKYIFDGNMRKQKWKRLTQEILLAPDQHSTALRRIDEELLS